MTDRPIIIADQNDQEPAPQVPTQFIVLLEGAGDVDGLPPLELRVGVLLKLALRRMGMKAKLAPTGAENTIPMKDIEP